MNHLSIIAALLLLLPFVACSPPAKTDPHAALLTFFPAAKRSDTLHLGIQTGAETAPIVSAIAIREALGDSLIQAFNPEFDTASTICRALSHFPLDDQYEAYTLRMEDNWWVHSGLLLYHQPSHRFVGVFPTSLLYGGDGGQVLRESWRIGDTDETSPDWIVRDLYHWLEVGESEPIEHNDNKVLRYQWKAGEFQALPTADSLQLITQFPIDW